MDKKVEEAVNAYIKEANSPTGSYTGITKDGTKPVQDADDL